MDRTFKHKGLEQLYVKGSKRGVQATQVNRLRLILARLAASSQPSDMELPGLRMHALSGTLQGHYAVTVSGNWRVTFRFVDGQPTDINLIDYH